MGEVLRYKYSYIVILLSQIMVFPELLYLAGLFCGTACNSKPDHAISKVGLVVGVRSLAPHYASNCGVGGCSEGCGSAMRASSGIHHRNASSKRRRRAQWRKVLVGLDSVP